MIESESNVTTTNPRSKSLRTTIPPEIRKALKLEAGSKLRWYVDIENDKIVVSVEKSE
ncbi:AbrB/MazE/SpoVT family DNA-binding domain-containing protein [Methanobrevibacter ruminantium]|uniref:AbrB/MazE/SpoVT family DNA-binding domain-containing protein n=1 Tax=Methanobrevibacter ruminantium TaxID=83816 RepID=UPI0026F2CB0E|nr:AbrB/MazE/SpoVT family DNA-binding domain-containing protein [Methanobrevibacter ruminantium]